MMGRRALLALVLIVAGLALATRASADLTYYVNFATGTDPVNSPDTAATTGWGRSAAKPFRTIGFANRNIRQPNTTNGHIIVYVADYDTPGYDSLPRPVNDPANGKRFFFIGNPSDPASCVLPGGDLYRSYVSLRGFKFSSSLEVDSTGANSAGAGIPRADSILQCIMPSWSDEGSRYCVFSDITLTGNGLKIGGNSEFCLRLTIGNSYYNITANSLGVGSTNDYILKFDYADSITFHRLVGTIRVDCQCQQGAVRFFKTRYSTFKYWNLTIHKTATDYDYLWKMRNYSAGNHFVADTIINYGPGNGDIMLIEQGGGPRGCQIADGIDTQTPLYFDSCLVLNANGTIGTNGAMSHLSISNTTLVSFTDPAFSSFEGYDIGDTIQFNHCTLVSPAGTRTIDLDGDESTAWQSDLKLILTNNIIAQFPTATNTGTTIGSCTRAGRRHSIYAHTGNSAKLDSVRKNVYWNLDKSTVAGDRVWYINNDCYGVGSAATGDADPLTSLQAGKDKTSTHAHPLFNMSPDTVAAGEYIFDGRISSASPARGFADGGSDAGAVAFNPQSQWVWVPADPDTTTIADSEFAISVTDTFTIKNSGSVNLTATWALMPASPGVSVVLDTSSVLIAAGRARTYTMTYYFPGSNQPAGIYVDYLNFTTNDPARPTVLRPLVRTRGLYSVE